MSKNLYLVHADTLLLWPQTSHNLYFFPFLRALNQQEALNKRTLFLHENHPNSKFITDQISKRTSSSKSINVYQRDKKTFVKALSEKKFNQLIYIPSRVSNTSETDDFVEFVNSLEYNIQVFLHGRFQTIRSLEDPHYLNFLNPEIIEIEYELLDEYQQDPPPIDMIKTLVTQKSNRAILSTDYFDVRNFVKRNT